MTNGAALACQTKDHITTIATTGKGNRSSWPNASTEQKLDPVEKVTMSHFLYDIALGVAQICQGGFAH